MTSVAESEFVDPGSEADLTRHRSALELVRVCEAAKERIERAFAEVTRTARELDRQLSDLLMPEITEETVRELAESFRSQIGELHAEAVREVSEQAPSRREAMSEQRKIITCPRCGLLLGVASARPYVDCPGCLGTISLFYDRPVAVVAPQKRDADLNWRRVR